MSLFTRIVMFGASASVCVVPLAFMFHDDYDDRLIGRIGLAVISFAGFVFSVRLLTGKVGAMWPETAALIIGVAVYLGWHYTRFVLRMRLEKKARRHELERRARTG